jgi:hypothetical protein
MYDIEHFIFMLKVALNDGFDAYRQPFLFFLLSLLPSPLIHMPYKRHTNDFDVVL